jgi:hypothetical protein
MGFHSLLLEFSANLCIQKEVDPRLRYITIRRFTLLSMSNGDISDIHCIVRVAH